MSKVYLIASGKGGTGKSMFTVNLATTLAAEGSRVVMVDMDMGQRNLDLYLGLESKVVYDVFDVLTGVCSLKQALVRDKRVPGMWLMASSPVRQTELFSPLQVEELCSRLKEEFDYIILDAPAGIGETLDLLVPVADEAIIVTTPEYAALRDADVLDRELIRSGLRKRYLVLNKLMMEMMEKGYTPGLAEIDQMIMADLAGVIQFDMNINISTNIGEPIVLQKGTYIEDNFKRIAQRICM